MGPEAEDPLTLPPGLSTIPPRRELAMARRVLVVFCFFTWFFTFIAATVSAQEPVRLGVLTIRSGPIASCGRQMEEGLQFALKERGGVYSLWRRMISV